MDEQSSRAAQANLIRALSVGGGCLYVRRVNLPEAASARDRRSILPEIRQRAARVASAPRAAGAVARVRRSVRGAGRGRDGAADADVARTAEVRRIHRRISDRRRARRRVNGRRAARVGRDGLQPARRPAASRGPQIAATGWPRATPGRSREIDGIGPFTAAIIASFAFGEPAACVDTNVRRVLGRLAGERRIDGTALLRRWPSIDRWPRAPARWNQALMDYGGRVCTVRPKCSECAVSAWCQTYGDQARTPLRVADTRATYDSKRARRVAKREAPFEGSARYYRGRVVDVLRRLAPGDTVALDALPALVSAGGAEADAGMVCDLVRALERAGLARVHDSRVSLPE